MSNLYDVVEICLQEVENGVQVEIVLKRYPDLAEELRPILQASVIVQSMAVSAPSAEVVRRNRAKLLQRAASLREVKPKPLVWFLSMQKWGLALALLMLFFFTGTSLVRASSSSLPGDSLYAVKRSWEDLTLSLTFDVQEREVLGVQYENERLEELRELLASGRPAQVDFAGVVQCENGDGWHVSNVLVIVSDESALPDQSIQVGAAVRVYGTTRGDGIVLAKEVELLPAGASLPEVEVDECEVEVEEPQSVAEPTHENSVPGSENEVPETDETKTPSSTASAEIKSITGTLTSINQQVWMIDNTLVKVGDAQIKGIPVVGAFVEAEGYFGADGLFVAVKIEIFNAELDNSSINSDTNGDNADSSMNSNDNGNDNDDDNHDKNNEDNGENDEDESDDD